MIVDFGQLTPRESYPWSINAITPRPIASVSTVSAHGCLGGDYYTRTTELFTVKRSAQNRNILHLMHLIFQTTHPALRAPLLIEGIFAGVGLGPLLRGVALSAGVCEARIAAMPSASSLPTTA